MPILGGGRPTASAPATFCQMRAAIRRNTRVRALGVGDRDRPAVVRGLADLQIERHFAQKLGAEPRGLAARPAKRKRPRSGILRAPPRKFPRHRRFVRSRCCAVPG